MTESKKANEPVVASVELPDGELDSVSAGAVPKPPAPPIDYFLTIDGVDGEASRPRP